MTKPRLLLLAFLLCVGPTARATDFPVAAGDVAGLIAAITAANADGVSDTIQLAAGNYDLTAVDNTSLQDGPNGLPVISSPIVIDGAGATIRRTGATEFRIFQVVGNGALTLNGVTVSGGTSPGATGAGGGILLNGSNNALTLTDCTVIDNDAAVFGGGIAVRGASEVVTLTRTSVSDNDAIAGGGIQVQASNVTLTLDRCRIADNHAASLTQTTDGAGMSVSGGPHTITLTDCVLERNKVSTGGGNSAQGGGISSSAEVNWTIARTTISGNRADSTAGVGAGGGIVDNGAAVWTLTNCTISGNIVTGPVAFLGGGGIDSDSSATFTLNNVTVTGNQARAGGGIEVVAGTVTISNSIVAGNGGNANSPDISGPVTSHGYNLFGTTTGGTVNLATGDIVNPAAGLGPLADNGGLTQTHALLPGSPAIDAANPAAPGSGGDACAATDQRGNARPAGNLCDIGAYEGEPAEETAIVSYCLPRLVTLRIRGAGRDSLNAAGFYDDGGVDVDYTKLFAVDIGPIHREFTPVPNKKGTVFTFKDANVRVILTPNLKGSSRGKFRYTLSKSTIAGIGPDDTIDLHFSGTGLPDAEGTVKLTAGRYRLARKRGALVRPIFFPARATAKVGAANADSLKFVGGMATNGVTPAQLGAVRVGFGPVFSKTIAGAQFKKNGDTFSFKSAKGDPPFSIKIDFLREKLTVKASKAELGALAAGPMDVVFDAGAGASTGGAVRNTIRLAILGTKRLY